MTNVPATLAERLRRHDQLHLLNWRDELDDDRRQALCRQVEQIDFEQVEQALRLDREGAAGGETPAAQAQRAKPPAELVRLPRSSADRAAWSEAAEVGREALAAGKIGAILVAGGQGTRLGFDHPKGMYPVGPVSGASLFQILAEGVLARSRQAGVAIPYYVMTSDATHDETVAFFNEHRHFGLNPNDVYFFRQGTMPAVDAATGRLLLADKDRLCLSPDGHGGVLAALARAGLFDDMKRRGIEHLYYHQVDNPTAVICDPAFLGFHIERGSEMSTKVVAKRSPEERMGVVVDLDGRTQIIEYSDLPPEIAARKDDSGGLLLWAGSTAIHVFNRDFLERLASEGSGLPFHLAHKKVPHLDETGRPVDPAEPNAYKFERFIFDALPSARTALVLEADRAREFNPVKNREGDDSAATAKAAMVALHAGWLREAGAEIPESVPVEISPLFALDADELKSKVAPGTVCREPVFLV